MKRLSCWRAVAFDSKFAGVGRWRFSLWLNGDSKFVVTGPLQTRKWGEGEHLSMVTPWIRSGMDLVRSIQNVSITMPNLALHAQGTNSVHVSKNNNAGKIR